MAYMFWHSILSDILSGICSDILSDVLFGLLSGILSSMSSGPSPLHSILGWMLFGSKPDPLHPELKKEMKTTIWRRRRRRRRRSCTFAKSRDPHLAAGELVYFFGEPRIGLSFPDQVFCHHSSEFRALLAACGETSQFADGTADREGNKNCVPIFASDCVCYIFFLTKLFSVSPAE